MQTLKSRHAITGEYPPLNIARIMGQPMGGFELNIFQFRCDFKLKTVNTNYN